MKYTLEQQTEAFVKLSKIIAEANGDWEPTRGEDRYFPHFYYNNDRFSFGDVDYWRSGLIIPAPLLFKSKELCEQVVKENLDLYEILHEIN